MIEDLHWLGLAWEGPMVSQSERLPLYREALARLHAARLIFPCHRSRRDVAEAIGAPHENNPASSALAAPAASGAPDAHDAHDEPIYPREWRPPADAPLPPLDAQGLATNWRFRVPDADVAGSGGGAGVVFFNDACLGPQQAVAGRDFGDFLVWRKDGLPSYQLACAVDDLALGVTEVVRGADLVRSTFRQLLLMRALATQGAVLPGYYHCPLMTDEAGRRLAKRHDALALCTLRASGMSPAEVCQKLELLK